MRPCLVEVGHIGPEHTLKLLLLKDQQVIEAFLTNTPHEALADGICSGCLIGHFEQLDATGGRYPSKTGSKFAIVIPNEIIRRLSIGRGFSKLLGRPGISRRACHADMDHFP